jgi:hypothetical protein
MKGREKKQLEAFLNGSEFKTSPAKDQQVLERALDRFRRNKQNINPVNTWRLIMKSPMTRVAAVLLLIVGIAVVKWQISDKPNNPTSPLTIFSLINTACAAEQTFFTGDSIVHITHEITLYPNADAPDMSAKLDELIESNFTLNRNLSFMRAWFSSRASLPVHSLKANGEYQWYTLELTGIGDKASVIQEHIWYDP